MAPSARRLLRHLSLAELREQVRKPEADSRARDLFVYNIAGIARCRMLFEGDRPVDFIYLEVNPAFATLTGLQDVVGRRVTEVIPGIRESNEDLFQSYARVVRSGIPERLETRVEGLGIWFSINIYRPRAGEFVAVFDTITERKLAEGALREANWRLELATRSGGLGIWDWTVDGDHLHWDDRMLELYGYDRETWPGTVKAWASRLHPEDLADALEDFRAALQGERPYHSEFRLLLPDGEVRHLVADATILRDESGAATRLIGLNRDVTKRRLAERKRLRMEKEVYQAQKLESLGSLAGGIAHDMNNVLAAILGIANNLQVRHESDPALAKALDTLEHAALRGRDLVKGLTNFVRKDLDQARPLDLNQLVLQETEILRQTLRQKVNLEIDLEPDLGHVLGESGSIASALMNLCVNAVDAMPQGGTLRLQTLSQEDNRILLRVVDTGEGMSAEVLAQATEPFFTTKPVGRGTGLGLAMVQNVARTHGGSLEIHSAPGQGTAISLTFPAAEGRPEAAASAAPGPSRTAALRVLLVDDDELIRTSFPQLLDLLGHRMEAVASGAQALALLQRERYDLLVLDHNMPGMTGAELLDRVKRADPGQKVMMATGYRDAELEAGLANWPGTPVLGKPFSLTEVRAALEALF